jgi:hypothetical protein
MVTVTFFRSDSENTSALDPSLPVARARDRRDKVAGGVGTHTKASVARGN